MIYVDVLCQKCQLHFDASVIGYESTRKKMKRHKKKNCTAKNVDSSSSPSSDVPSQDNSRSTSPSGFLNPPEAFSPVQYLPEDSSVTPPSSQLTDELFKSPLPVISSPLPQRLKRVRPNASKSLFPKAHASMHKGTPPKLLYRQEEQEKILLWLAKKKEGNTGGSFYISGSPGKPILVSGF